MLAGVFCSSDGSLTGLARLKAGHCGQKLPRMAQPGYSTGVAWLLLSLSVHCARIKATSSNMYILEILPRISFPGDTNLALFSLPLEALRLLTNTYLDGVPK